MSRRAFVVVLDACGAGELPDAADYGDAGSDTLVHVAEAVGGLDLPTLGTARARLDPRPARRPAPRRTRCSTAACTRSAPARTRRRATGSSWASCRRACRRTPTASREGVLDLARQATGREFCCNAPRNGITAIDEFGEHHLRTGELILYTSQDSVMQIAAHIDVVDRGRAARGLRGDARRR